MKLKHLIIFLVCFFALNAVAQSWNYRTPITVGHDGVQRSDYQIKIVVNTLALIQDGKLMPDGSDLRFGDACQTTFYSHWIENAFDSDTTLIWVKVPLIPATNDTTIFMYYGNPAATTTNNFSTTFPNALLTGGNNVTLSGNNSHDWIQVDAGDTLFITAGSALTINGARKAIIDGVVWGKGSGYQIPAINTNGNGPGAGSTSSAVNSGAGGGSYAGVGGTGGYDSGDTPGTGGGIYGTDSGTDIDMGSSGGGGTTDAGAGGGSFSLDAETIRLNGTINVNGNDAPTSASTSRGGGGGAGGGVKLTAVAFTGSGTISANGGIGGVGTSTANDSGGGGGGGRVKQFTGTSAGSYTITVDGGIGGPYGTAAPATNGGTGVVQTINVPIFAFPVGIVETESSVMANIVNIPSDTLCTGNPIYLTLNNPYLAYLWSNGETTDTIAVYAADTIDVVVIDNYNCMYYDTLSLVFYPEPIANVTMNPENVCTGDTITVSTQNSFVSYDWGILGSTTNVATVTQAGNYSVTVTDTNGCSTTTNFTHSPFPLPEPVITANPPQACPGEQITLSTQNYFTTYAWSTGSNSVSTTGMNAGIYTIDVLDTNGCSAQASFNYTPFAAPVVTITQVDFTLEATTGFATYQWYLDGNILVDETGETTMPIPDLSGNYIVVVTDSNGCTGTDSLYIEGGSVNELPNWLNAAYPNPTSGTFTLVTNTLTADLANIQVIDLTGKLVLENEIVVQTGKHYQTIDLTALNNGAYFVRIQLANKQHTVSVIKQ